MLHRQVTGSVPPRLRRNTAREPSGATVNPRGAPSVNRRVRACRRGNESLTGLRGSVAVSGRNLSDRTDGDPGCHDRPARRRLPPGQYTRYAPRDTVKPCPVEELRHCTPSSRLTHTTSRVRSARP